MSKQKVKKNDELETTETTTTTVIVTTETLQELVGKKAEIQTRIDHLNADLTAAQVDMTEIDDDITLIS